MSSNRTFIAVTNTLQRIGVWPYSDYVVFLEVTLMRIRRGEIPDDFEIRSDPENPGSMMLVASTGEKIWTSKDVPGYDTSVGIMAGAMISGWALIETYWHFSIRFTSIGNGLFSYVDAGEVFGSGVGVNGAIITDTDRMMLFRFFNTSLPQSAISNMNVFVQQIADLRTMQISIERAALMDGSQLGSLNSFVISNFQSSMDTLSSEIRGIYSGMQRITTAAELSEYITAKLPRVYVEYESLATNFLRMTQNVTDANVLEFTNFVRNSGILNMANRSQLTVVFDEALQNYQIVPLWQNEMTQRVLVMSDALEADSEMLRAFRAVSGADITGGVAEWINTFTSSKTFLSMQQQIRLLINGPALTSAERANIIRSVSNTMQEVFTRLAFEGDMTSARLMMSSSDFAYISDVIANRLLIQGGSNLTREELEASVQSLIRNGTLNGDAWFTLRNSISSVRQSAAKLIRYAETLGSALDRIGVRASSIFSGMLGADVAESIELLAAGEARAGESTAAMILRMLATTTRLATTGAEMGMTAMRALGNAFIRSTESVAMVVIIMGALSADLIMKGIGYRDDFYVTKVVLGIWHDTPSRGHYTLGNMVRYATDNNFKIKFLRPISSQRTGQEYDGQEAIDRLIQYGEIDTIPGAEQPAIYDLLDNRLVLGTDFYFEDEFGNELRTSEDVQRWSVTPIGMYWDNPWENRDRMNGLITSDYGTSALLPYMRAIMEGLKETINTSDQSTSDGRTSWFAAQTQFAVFNAISMQLYGVDVFHLSHDWQVREILQRNRQFVSQLDTALAATPIDPANPTDPTNPTDPANPTDPTTDPDPVKRPANSHQPISQAFINATSEISDASPSMVNSALPTFFNTPSIVAASDMSWFRNSWK